jgi:hypothetical protein
MSEPLTKEQGDEIIKLLAYIASLLQKKRERWEEQEK